MVVFAEGIAPHGPNVHAFRQAMQELGYVEGRNIHYELRSAENQHQRLPGLMQDVLKHKLDVLVAGSTPVTLAARKATSTTPIVFGGVLDPVGSGVVQNLARPGGNITGATVGAGGGNFTGKCLALLKETVPAISSIAVLLNPTHPVSAQVRPDAQRASASLKVTVQIFEAADASGLEKALSAIGASGAQAILVAPDPFLTGSSSRIALFAASRKLPGLHFSRRFAEAGGLMSYGGTLEDSYRKAAAHVDKILKGAKPGDLPVEQPTRFELVINQRTARDIGVQIPVALRLQATQVID
jgi:putative ABC transport system substrate-binding protein